MKKLKECLFIILLLNSIYSFSQNGYPWAKKIGTVNGDAGTAFLGKDGSIYCGGSLNRPVLPGESHVHSSNNETGFLAKYDQNGNQVWAVGFGGGPAGDFVYGYITALDTNNNCLYYTGTFRYKIIIGSHTLNAMGGTDLFLAKFDFEGNCLWIKQAASSSDDSQPVAQIDSIGNIFWTGLLGSNGQIDSIPVQSEGFLAKIDPSGSVLYGRHELSGGYVAAIQVINNLIYLSILGEKKIISVDTAICASEEKYGIILASCDVNGNVLLIRRFSSTGWTAGTDIKLDKELNILLCGLFTDSIDFGGTILSNNGNADYIISKLDKYFNVKWVHQGNFDGNGSVPYLSHITLLDNIFYIAGRFSGTIYFGEYFLNAPPMGDLVLAKFDTTGICLGVKQFGIAYGNTVLPTVDGSLIITGGFRDTVQIGSTTLVSKGDWDFFVAKSDPITGVKELATGNNLELVIYANPNEGTCRITIPDEFLHEKELTLTIFDLHGKVIQRAAVSTKEGRFQVNISAEARGTYPVSLSNGRKNYTGKIIFK